MWTVACYCGTLVELDLDMRMMESEDRFGSTELFALPEEQDPICPTCDEVVPLF